LTTPQTLAYIRLPALLIVCAGVDRKPVPIARAAALRRGEAFPPGGC